MSSALQQSMPFAFGILLVLAQPLIDKVWKPTFDQTYKSKFLNIEGGAEWVADVAAFLPNALLTTMGALNLSVESNEPNTGWLFWAACGVPLLSLILFLYEATSGKPQSSPRLLGTYSKLSVWLIALNSGGIFLAFHYN